MIFTRPIRRRLVGFILGALRDASFARPALASVVLAALASAAVAAIVDETESNNTTASADLLAQGDVGSGAITLATGDSIDFWRRPGIAGGDLIFARIENDLAVPSQDSRLWLYLGNAASPFFQQEDVRAYPYSALGGVAMPSSGDLHLRVRESTSASMVGYRLYQAVVHPQNDNAEEAEPNDSAGSANAISKAMTTGTLGDSSGVDVFSFEAEAGAVAILVLDNDPEKNGTICEAHVQILSTDGTTVLAQNESGIATTSTSANAAETCGPATLGSAGTYYVRVKHNLLTPKEFTYRFVLFLDGAPATGPTPTPTASPTVSASPTPSPSPTRSPSPSASPSPTPSPSPTRSPSPSPSSTPSPSASPTRSPSPTSSPSPTPSSTPTASPTVSPSPTPSPTPPVYVTLTSPNEENGGRFGVSVVGGNDMTGDSLPDLLIGAQFEDPGSATADSGMAYLFSGETLAVAREISPPSPMLSGQFGRNVRGVGDLDSDGLVDFVASAPNESVSGFSGAGRVHVFSGGSGAPIRTLVSPNPETGGQFGTRANGVNDVTGDGRTDLVISATFENPGGSPTDSGRVYIFNGVTGALLRTLASPNAESGGAFGTSSIGIKDVTGDGRGEVVIGAPGEDPDVLGLPDGAGMAYLFNGATGALVWQTAAPSPLANAGFGKVVSRLDDVTGDGRMDVAIGAPDSNGSGRVFLLNGATGGHLRTLVSPNPESGGLFGQSITNILDANGDGYGDLVIGAPAENADGITDSGRAYVFSGRNGALLLTLSSPEPEASADFGFAVGTAPDLDGNGYVEFLIGARRADPGASPSDAGRAYLFYGKLLP